MSNFSDPRTSPGFAEVEFLAEETLIEIQPNFNMGEPIRFVSGETGPFSRRQPTRVSLWMALYLERLGKCQIVVPDWLNVSHLTAALRDERERGTSNFAPLKDEAVQVAVALLNRDYLVGEYCGGQRVRIQMQSLITELLMIRRCKTIEGLKQIDVSTSVVEITNMTSIERANIRPQSSAIMDSLASLWKIRDSVVGDLDPEGHRSFLLIRLHFVFFVLRPSIAISYNYVQRKSECPRGASSHSGAEKNQEKEEIPSEFQIKQNFGKS